MGEAPLATADPRDSRRLATVRLTLAVAAAALFVADYRPSDALHPELPVILGFGTLYAAVLLGLAFRGSRIAVAPVTHWIDTALVAGLVVVGGGPASGYFTFFIFLILRAALEWGFAKAMWTTGVSAAVHAGAIGVAHVGQAPFDLDRALMRLIVLVLLGYVLARWGDHESRQRAGLALFRDVSRLWNPRLGASRSLAGLIERLRRFVGADIGLFVEREGDKTTLQRLAGDTIRDEPAPFGIADALLALERHPTVLWPDGPEDAHAGRVAALLDLGAVLIVNAPHSPGRRVFLVLGKREGEFHEEQADITAQALAHAWPALEAVRLLERMSAHATTEAMQRLACDIHDVVLQPYAGIRMGLAALDREITNEHIHGHVRRLADAADTALGDIRAWSKRLSNEAGEDTSLVHSVRRMGQDFARMTGIEVAIDASEPLPAGERLATEASHIVAEGLSNIRKHTAAARARVRLEAVGERLVLRIENDSEAGPTFRPRTISERAEALGGKAEVLRDDHRTAVVVEIPL